MSRFFNKRTFLLLAILFSLLAVFYIGTTHFSLEVSPEDIENESFWQNRIVTKGGKRAYKEFSDIVYKKVTRVGSQHTSAHVFGGALYAVEGIGGIAACGSDFSYGCFHEFIGRAVNELGIDTVESLNETCLEVLGSEAPFCQHGVGHGIQSFFGYEREDLDRALEVCDGLQLNDPIGGCAGGIYMEYNFQTMLADDAKVRKSNNLFTPCSELPDRYRLACSFWQPQWWWKYLYDNESASEYLTQMGLYCNQMTPNKQKLIEACFSGIGNIAAARGDFKPTEIKRMCSASSNNNRLSSLCHAFAANRITRERGLEAGLSTCSNLKGEDRTFCEVFATNQQYLIR
jgi:hypothetical protein